MHAGIYNESMRAASIFVLAALMLRGQDLPAPNGNAARPSPADVLLGRIRAHMIDTLTKQPNYTCLETVERSNRSGREKDFRLQDTLRLEVALVDGKEMFAWPGSKSFEDTDMRHFAPTGMFGSGEFALYARTVFGGRSTEIEFRGEEQLGQRNTMRYDFRVPTEAGMRIRQQETVAVTGYHGSFYAEVGTLDVLRMEVTADALPRNMDLRDVIDTLEYARLRIGSGDFLLPSVSEVLMTSFRGDTSRNRIRFSACHEFAGESTLKFGDDETDPASPAAFGKVPAGNEPAPKREIGLPKNTEIILQLVDEIDTQDAAVGDIVRARLTGDVKAKGQVLLPKGTVVSGRVVRLERKTNFTVLGLIFEEAESENLHAALNLTFDSVTGSGVLGRNVRWGTEFPVRLHEGLVPLPAGHIRVGRGILLYWRT
jgi:hypothetical protein